MSISPWFGDVHSIISDVLAAGKDRLVSKAENFTFPDNTSPPTGPGPLSVLCDDQRSGPPPLIGLHVFIPGIEAEGMREDLPQDKTPRRGVGGDWREIGQPWQFGGGPRPAEQQGAVLEDRARASPLGAADELDFAEDDILRVTIGKA